MNDTIVAISTPRGFGGIGVVRLSGSSALSIAQKIFSKKIKHPRKAYFGYIFDVNTKERIDTAIAIYFKAPHSYTGEDVVELQMHGGIKNLDVTVKLLIGLGARLAERGEFTRRAFLNGKMDLVESEAVIELIQAKTEKAMKVASKRLFGGVSSEIFKIKKQILSVLSEIEGSIDFPLDVDQVNPNEIKDKLENISKEIEKLLSTYRAGKSIEQGVKVVIAGKTNVGKSTLLNALLKFDRAIVSETPGTTRDTVEEEIDFFGVPVRFIDTAGIRETTDKVEALGKKRSLKAIEQADIVLFMFDASEELKDDDIELAKLTEGKERIIVLNKTDLPVKLKKEDLNKLFVNENIVEISALKKKGIEMLEKAIYNKIIPDYVETPLITTETEKNSLHNALLHLKEAEKIVGKGMDELVSEELKETLDSLGVITGENVSTDILNTIFSRFCIGK